jgi:hypothetical protein
MCSPWCDNNPGGIVRTHCIRFAAAKPEVNTVSGISDMRANLDYTTSQKISAQKRGIIAHTILTLVNWSPVDVVSMDSGEVSILQIPRAEHRSKHACADLVARNKIY